MINVLKFDFPSAEDYIDEVNDNDEDLRKNQSDDWEGGLTFIAKSSGELSLGFLYEKRKGRQN